MVSKDTVRLGWCRDRLAGIRKGQRQAGLARLASEEIHHFYYFSQRTPPIGFVKMSCPC